MAGVVTSAINQMGLGHGLAVLRIFVSMTALPN